jgi:hypothetical protein
LAIIRATKPPAFSFNFFQLSLAKSNEVFKHLDTVKVASAVTLFDLILHALYVNAQTHVVIHCSAILAVP